MEGETIEGYIDLFVLPVPKKKLALYQKMSTKMGKIMKEYGATEYREFIGNDLKPKMGPGFLKMHKLKPGEVLVSAVIGYKSKAVREKCNKDAMNDPRFKKMMANPDAMNWMDMSRMCVGGFATFVKPF